MTIIVLMHMLIAAMSESYASLSLYKTELGMRSKTSVMMTIERQVGSIYMTFVAKNIMTQLDNEWGILISTMETPSIP